MVWRWVCFSFSQARILKSFHLMNLLEFVTRFSCLFRNFRAKQIIVLLVTPTFFFTDLLDRLNLAHTQNWAKASFSKTYMKQQLLEANYLKQQLLEATITWSNKSEGPINWSNKSEGPITWSNKSEGPITWSNKSEGLITWSFKSDGLVIWCFKSEGIIT